MINGHCECGRIRYEIDGEINDYSHCHCGQCRRTSGHYVSATSVPRKNFTLTMSDGLKWYRSSARARRGFCRECGSSLFWSADARDTISIMSGTIDGETGLHTAAHICVADKGDYYELNPSEPQYDAYEYPPPPDSQPINE